MAELLEWKDAMASQTQTQMQQSPSSPAVPGSWKLGPGRAMTLLPREPGVLRVAQGQLWATFDGPHGGPPNDLGDHVLGAGEQLRLRSGQRLVLESWNARAAAYFSWDPIAEPARSAPPRLAAVAGPLADLRLALALGAGATGRLVAALAGLIADLPAGRRRESSSGGTLSAQSGVCRAQGQA